MPFEYRFPRPALTVDCAVFSPAEGELDVLLVERRADPFEGEWATPGGFVDIDEPIGDAAVRELAEETGLEGVGLEAFGVFGAPGRDPRGRVVSVGHCGLVDRARREPAAGDDAADWAWHPTDDLPEMAFDHADLVDEAHTYLRKRARTGPIGRSVLEEPFSLRELRNLYDAVLEEAVSLDALREALVARAGLVSAEDADQTPDADAEVYSFDRSAYERIVRNPLSPWLD